MRLVWTLQPYILQHQKAEVMNYAKKSAGWFSCTREPISILGGGKLWLVGG